MCVAVIAPGRFGVAHDRDTGSFRFLPSGFNFLWQGVVPQRISVRDYGARNSEIITAKVPVPPLGELKSDYYSISFPVSVIYEIDARRLAVNAGSVWSSAASVTAAVSRAFETSLERELSRWISPLYGRYALLNNRDRILHNAAEGASRYCAGVGITIIAVELAGAVIAPDERTIAEGMAFYSEMRMIERNNKKELLFLGTTLEKDRQLRKDYFEKLNEMSKIIKANPDMLKYIYIDKMAGNVKVIIAPEKSGMPFGFDYVAPEKPAQRKGEIDNLR